MTHGINTVKTKETLATPISVDDPAQVRFKGPETSIIAMELSGYLISKAPLRRPGT